ncbi:hypothetical protein [Domibacillus enclensis]|uniref:Ribbon-helix-helix protein, copG family n=1 Tax=Domibacillus enclensis TaxID=1017273 RepID=A0A1N7C257_9BACI|nr:hypothetical protein [Domibacillus enclensis]OXS74209.1 hypothetical protein B1B05_17190 [Domibacillus enclensis]SIR57711.1 hypothetical protein SAMN05443094_11134 [Domibacillus enclensis]
MSKMDDIKNLKRKQSAVTPAQALTETYTKEENNVSSNEGTNQSSKVERKRVSFDIRTDLHKELKMQSLVQEKNIYIMIEEALEAYLKNNR